jgi:hypothetical protein
MRKSKGWGAIERVRALEPNAVEVDADGHQAERQGKTEAGQRRDGLERAVRRNRRNGFLVTPPFLARERALRGASIEQKTLCPIAGHR